MASGYPSALYDAHLSDWHSAEIQSPMKVATTRSVAVTRCEISSSSSTPTTMAWAKNMKRLLKKTARKVRESPDKALAKPAFKAVQKHYRTILTKGRREIPEPPPRIKGKRGRIAKSDAYCRISSYLKSMGYKGYNPMTAIQIALMGRAKEMV